MDIKIHVKFKDHVMWPFQRSGWAPIMNLISNYHMDEGILFDGYLDLFFGKNQQFGRPWCGVVHNTLTHPPHVPLSYGFRHHDQSLKTLIQQNCFQKSLRLCQGIFTLSPHTAQFLRRKLDVPINQLWLATETPDIQFDFHKFQTNPTPRIVMIGHWLRKYSSLKFLQTRWQRTILYAQGKLNFPKLIDQQAQQKNYDLQSDVLQRLDNQEYDELLSQNIVFLDLYDAAANNVVVECIVRGTPLLINRLPAAEDYLGKDYPFFYDSITEAGNKSNNLNLILETHNYLLGLPLRSNLSLEYFNQDFLQSPIIQNLKLYKYL